MLRSLTRLGLFAVLVAALVGGCKGTTTGGKDYIIRADRKLAATIDADIATVHAAARVVLEEDMLFEITDDAVDAREGILRGRTARKNTVRVETFRKDVESTQVLIFVGPFGDKAAASDVFEALVERVGF
ncbi:MAG: DUF3568 family protein [Planctomycetota bacterium]|jgi:hypothetical protein